MKVTSLVTLIMCLFLAACSTTKILPSENPEADISGSITRHLFAPDRIEISVAGRVYRGEWRITSLTTTQLAKINYPHRRHMGYAQLDLTADDGHQLICHFNLHSQMGEGTCSDGLRSYPMSIR